MGKCDYNNCYQYTTRTGVTEAQMHAHRWSYATPPTGWEAIPVTAAEGPLSSARILRASDTSSAGTARRRVKGG